MSVTAIDTPLGRLEARVLPDPVYPGIQIGLHRNREWLEFAWVEVDCSEETPVLKIHGYNATKDEPVFDIRETAENITRVFNNLKE